MSRSVPDVVYGLSGQTIALRVSQGQATSATFAVFEYFAGDDDAAEFSGSATVDAFSQALSAASGAGETDPQKLNLTTTSMVASQRYLVAEGSRREWIQPIEIATGYARVRFPLQNAYTTAATVKSTTIGAAIDNTWAAALENISETLDPNPGYRVRWDVVVSAVHYVAYSFFDLVRAAISHDVDIADVNDRAPGLIDSLPIEYRGEQGRPLVDSAWRAVQAHMAALGVDTDAFRDDLILDELVILRALAILADGGWHPPAYAIAEYRANAIDNYARFVETHLQVTAKTALSRGNSGAVETVRAVPAWSK